MSLAKGCRPEALSRKPVGSERRIGYDAGMDPLCHRRHRFPAEVIQHAIWLYLRFTLSYRGSSAWCNSEILRMVF